jgi:hypothetical protein
MPPLARLARLLTSACALALAACASTYIPPGGKADLQALAPASMQDNFAAKPTAPFPAGIAFVRVQAPSYTNFRMREAGGVAGGGRYSIVLIREAEEDAQMQRVAQLPQVAGVTGLNRMLVPEKLEGEADVRQAASRLQADMVFLYTFDTTFHDTDASRPLTFVTLGLFPTRRIDVTTTVSALLLDTRTGYVYATSEATKTSATNSSVWGSEDSADEARRANERAAFAQMVDDFAGHWPKLLARYAAKG